MRVAGIDFTSAPTRRKPILVVEAGLAGDRVRVDALRRLDTFASFEEWLRTPGPWIGAFDFPFTMSRRFLTGIGWPEGWPAYARHLAKLTRPAFRAALEAYKAPRAPGDREHPREFEIGSGAVSPQKLYGVPVALMQFEGAPRLDAAGLHLPGLRDGDPSRIAVEGYPGVAARALIGRTSYKTEDRGRAASPDLRAARDLILSRLCGAEGRARFGLSVEAPADLARDPSGDPLDAMLCAVQAAWAWRLMTGRPDRLAALDLSGGWIADPDVVDRLPRRA